MEKFIFIDGKIEGKTTLLRFSGRLELSKVNRNSNFTVLVAVLLPAKQCYTRQFFLQLVLQTMFRDKLYE